MAELVSRGAEAIILGCTEIELLIGPSDDTNVPLSDTTRLQWRQPSSGPSPPHPTSAAAHRLRQKLPPMTLG